MRFRGHTAKPRYMDVAIRLARGGIRPAYATAFPPSPEMGSGDAQQPLLRTVDDYVRWLASPALPPGIDPAQGRLSPRRALRKRQQVVRRMHG